MNLEYIMEGKGTDKEEKENENKALSEVYYDLWASCIKFSNEKGTKNDICSEYYEKFQDHSIKYIEDQKKTKSKN